MEMQRSWGRGCNFQKKGCLVSWKEFGKDHSLFSHAFAGPKRLEGGYSSEKEDETELRELAAYGNGAISAQQVLDTEARQEHSQ